MPEFTSIIEYFVNIAAVVIILNSLLLFLGLLSIRPNMRKRESMYIGLIEGLTEVCVGAWLLVSKPIFINIDYNFIFSLFLLISTIIALFVRLYFFAVIRFIYSR